MVRIWSTGRRQRAIVQIYAVIGHWWLSIVELGLAYQQIWVSAIGCPSYALGGALLLGEVGPVDSETDPEADQLINHGLISLGPAPVWMRHLGLISLVAPDWTAPCC